VSNPLLRLAAFAAPFALFACTNYGPGTVARDRFDYGAAITDSWKRQTLLNIVKLRYLDPPIFVDVGQIVAGYTIESSASAGAAISGDPPGAAIGGTGASLGGAVRFIDRPTVTYVPMTGNKFVRALMTPLPPESLFQAMAGGWAADGLLAAAVSTINGLENANSSLDGMRLPNPKFLRAAQLLREIQMSGALGLRVHKDGQAGAPSSLVVVRQREVPDEIAAKGKELRELLGLDAGAEEFSLAFGAVARDGNEIAVVTRSVLHILISMGMGVDVPEKDVEEGRVTPGLPAGEKRGRLIHVRCSDSAPDEAYVSVRYRDHWYWIDDRDLGSKRSFAFMMMLFTMSDSAATDNAPVVTIPA
jgi:hypothetical protein